MTDPHRAPEINGMEGVLADLTHALKHAQDALDSARQNLGEHRVTHEALLAKQALDNTIRVVKVQIAVAKKS
jgi:hypothetical protein